MGVEPASCSHLESPRLGGGTPRATHLGRNLSCTE